MILLFLCLLPVAGFIISKKINKLENFFWYGTLFLFLFFLTSRLNFFADTYWYKLNFDNLKNFNFFFFNNEPFIRHGWMLIQKILIFFNLNFYFLLFFTSLFSLYALDKYLKKQDEPWIGLIASVPLILITLNAGYIKQSIAFSICLLMLSKKKEIFYFNILAILFCAFFFHSSAIFLILFFIKFKNINFNQISILLIILCLIGLLNLNFVFEIYLNYFGENLNFTSGGIYFRFALIFISSLIIIFLLKNKIKYNYINMSYCVLFLILLSVFFSTVADRLLFYCIPIYIFLCSNINKFLKKNANKKILINHFLVFFITCYNLIYFFLLLNFSPNKYYLNYISIFKF